MTGYWQQKFSTFELEGWFSLLPVGCNARKSHVKRFREWRSLENLTRLFRGFRKRKLRGRFMPRGLHKVVDLFHHDKSWILSGWGCRWTLSCWKSRHKLWAFFFVLCSSFLKTNRETTACSQQFMCTFGLNAQYLSCPPRAPGYLLYRRDDIIPSHMGDCNRPL